MRTRSKSPRRGENTSNKFRIKRMKKVLEIDSYEETVENIKSTFDLIIAMEEVEKISLSDDMSGESKHNLFCSLIDKATNYYSSSIVLEVLAYIDQYYSRERIKSIDRSVHDYLTKVIRKPTPSGLRRLLRKILEGKNNVHENIFSNPSGTVLLSKSETWVLYKPTIKEQVATLIQWIDSRCSNVSMEDSVNRIKNIFLEPGEDGADDTTTTESIKIQLNCPLSTTRIVIPACSKDHLQPFDLEHFLSISLQRNDSLPEGADPLPWKCPVSGQVIDKDSIIMDHRFADILAKVGPNVDSVVFFKDGTWKVDVPNDQNDSQAIQFIDVPDGDFLPGM